MGSRVAYDAFSSSWLLRTKRGNVTNSKPPTTLAMVTYQNHASQLR